MSHKIFMTSAANVSSWKVQTISYYNDFKCYSQPLESYHVSKHVSTFRRGSINNMRYNMKRVFCYDP